MLDLEQLADVVPRGHADAHQVWAALGDAGVISRVVDALTEDKHDIGPLAELLEWLDARAGVGITLSICVQVATVVPLLRLLGSGNTYAAEVLRATERGRNMTALAVTDSGSGSSLATFATRIEAAPSSAGSRLEGHKRWITNATTCTHALVLARRDDRRHFTSFGWALVPADASGLSRCAAPTGLFPGAGLGDLRFTNVELKDDYLVGRPGRALADFAVHMTLERIASAVWGRAFARRMLLRTRAGLVERESDGRPLWENAAVRARFARCVVAWSSLDAMCRDQPGESLARSMLLKAHSGETVKAIAQECSSLAGAEAFEDGGLAVLMSQAQIFDTAGGASATMLAGVADHVDELLGAL